MRHPDSGVDRQGEWFMRQILTGAMWLVVAGAGAVGAELGPYQVIIDKAPFGSVTPAATGATPSALARFAFVGLVQTGDGQLQAIIQDKQSRQCYFKTEGETVEDVKVQKIDRGGPAPRLVLRRGVETGTLTYEKPRSVAPSVPAPAPMSGGAIPMPTPGGSPPGPEPPRRIPFRR